MTATLDELEHTKEDLRDTGLAALGVTGEEQAPGLLTVLRQHGAYPLAALFLLYVVDQFQASAFTTLAPEISDGLGIPVAGVAALYSLQALTAAVVSLPVAALVQRVPRRAAVSVVTAFLWALTTGMTGFAAGSVALALLVAADGASSASVRTVHPPLLYDLYPPAARIRIFSLYNAAIYLSLVAAPALVALLTFVGLTWRGTFLVLGAICLVIACFAVRLRDPGFGAQDTALLRAAVRAEIGGATSGDEEVDTDLRFFETVRRVLLLATVRRLLAAFTFLGMFVTPLGLFLAVYLNDHFLLGPTGRGVFNACTPVGSIAGLMLMGRLGDRWYRGDPALLMRRAGIVMGVGVVLLAFSVVMPTIALFGVVISLALGCFAVLAPGMTVVLQSVIPAQARSHVVALQGIAMFGVGSLLGVLFLGGLQDRFGTAVAISCLAVPGVVAGAVLASTSRLVDADIARLVDTVVEEEEARALRLSGAKVPLLAVRKVDFAYDSLQVLFDVSFTLDEGEMVALLGTNGAGKSTLLRVISGLGLPSAGSVRFQGADVTFLDPQRRVGLGIMQISGGKGTFPRLTVMENLRAFGYPLGRDRAAVEAGIEKTFEVFPRLAERRHQVAGTMSGGENQMLSLACAFMVKPRILLIDELSLGLAPKIVGELLDLVRRINAEGTAVVLVEQSVNIALSLVHHAYFMEKGQMRFDGPAEELLARGDLLRSVFLEGAAKGLGR